MSPIWCYHNCLSISIFRVQTTKLQVLFYFHWYFVFLSNTTVARARDVALERALYQMITNTELYHISIGSRGIGKNDKNIPCDKNGLSACCVCLML